MTTKCLNCQQKIDSQFCPHCGQESSTHRFSMKHFFIHVFVNGVFQLDKGFFYTLRELFVRPGHSIREYIEGKRTQHFNYFTFIILTITIGHLVGSVTDVRLIDTTLYFSGDSQSWGRFGEITRENPKLFTMVRIPFLALVSFIVFNRSKQNYTENLILNIYKVCGEIFLAIFFTLMAILFGDYLSLSAFSNLTALVTWAYSIWFYYQYFSVYGFSKGGLFIRSLLTTLVLILVVATVTTFMIGVQEGFHDAR